MSSARIIATAHYDHADNLWIAFDGQPPRKASSIAEAVGQAHRVVSNDDDDYASFGVALEDNELLIVADDRPGRCVLAYGIPADGHTTMTDVASGEDRTYVPDFDREAIDKVEADYPAGVLVRWQARSVAADAGQPGALLVVQPGAEAHAILAEVGEIFRRARDAERAAAGAVYTAAEIGARAGLPETRIAELLGVNRTTVRTALGK